MGFSAKISTTNLVPIFENSQGQCPRKDFRIFPVLSGFIRILISCPNFFLKKDNIFFVKNLYFFLLFLGFSAKISTKNLVPIFENSQGQCPRKDFRIFPVLSGFIRILISCPNFFLKKDNIFFVKNLYFFLLFLGFSAKISTKNLVPIFENSQGQCPRIPIFLLLQDC